MRPALRTALLEAGYDVALAAADHAELRPAWQGGLFAEDPSVDRAVRPLLDSLWERAGRRMSLQQWSRVRDVTVFLVQVTRDLRDDRPLFALRAEDGGKGQVAGEGDLQAHLMDRLRWRFGRDAVWERSRVAGGRSDLSVRFPECEIPIEVKAEYRDISEEHIRGSYLTQTDEYAAVRDDLAVLLILDLRAANAIGEPQSGDDQAGDGIGTRYSLYSLRESFWVDGLAPDPQIAGATPKTVVIGLVPGNRPLPSATTSYSRRPRGTPGSRAPRADVEVPNAVPTRRRPPDSPS